MPLVLVVRHGHVAGNAEHRFIGQTDVPLDDLGRSQASALSERLGRLPITRIISSDLARAVDTVRPTAERLGLPIATDARLREIHNGEWSGLLPNEIAEAWPEMWASYVGGADVRRPGGETWEEVRRRAVEVIEEQENVEGTVVLCTHGGPTLNLARWATGIPAGGNVFRGTLAAVANTSLTAIELPGPRLVIFNDSGHLAEPALDVHYPFEPVT
ncbi:MAG: histidine phosphatase family protein [Acidimicrobiia bacterium]|nr:histidine phosphatase family protein [Acidimicrobiia bacterium]